MYLCPPARIGTLTMHAAAAAQAQKHTNPGTTMVTARAAAEPTKLKKKTNASTVARLKRV